MSENMTIEDIEDKSEFPDSDEEKEPKVDFSSLQETSDNNSSTKQKECSDRLCSFLQKYFTSILLLVIFLLGILIITIGFSSQLSKLNDRVYKEVKELTEKLQYLEHLLHAQCNRTSTDLPPSDNNSILFDLQMQLSDFVSTQRDIQNEVNSLPTRQWSSESKHN